MTKKSTARVRMYSQKAIAAMERAMEFAGKATEAAHEAGLCTVQLHGASVSEVVRAMEFIGRQAISSMQYLSSQEAGS